MSCNNNNSCKTAIRVTRIFDGARREQKITRELTLTDFHPLPVVQPLTYVSAEFSNRAVIDTQSVFAVQGSRKSRVSIGYTFPVIVNYIDAAGNAGWARSMISDTIDLMLTLPTCPYTFEVETTFVSRIGTIDGERAIVTGCLLTVVKVLTECDLVVPSCNLVYPRASLTEDIACNVVFGN